MKNLITIVALLVVALVVPQSAFAQASTTQTVNLEVNALYRISVSGSPSALVVTGGTAGSDTIGVAVDASTTYSITQNVGNTVKLTAGTGSALPTGLHLYIRALSTRGTSAGFMNLTNGSTVDVVTGIARGADITQGIRYEFTAQASAGTFTGSRTVTLTLTN